MVLQFPEVFQSGGVTLTQTQDEIYVEFEKPLSAEAFNGYLGEHRMEMAITGPGGDKFQPGKTGPIIGGWLKALQGKHFNQYYPKVMADDRVRTAIPVYHRADLLPEKTAVTFADRLLVRFWPQVAKDEINEIIQKHHCKDISPKSNLLGQNLYLVQILDPKARHGLEAAAQFEQQPQVKHAQPSWIQLFPGADEWPNDGRIDEQWHLAQIHAEQGWDISQGHEDIIIAMLDMGFDTSHVDLVDKFIDGCDATVGDACGDELYFTAHGTQTSGVAAAATNNEDGVAGVAWNCRMMPIRVARDPSGSCWEVKHEDWILKGLQEARRAGAHVINMSFRWLAPMGEIETEINDIDHENFIVMVASSGNFGTIDGLSALDAVMAVGASNRDDQREAVEFNSAHGPALNVAAPGVSILTTSSCNRCDRASGLPEGDYLPMSGTSFSAPQVAGLAALLRSAYPGLSAREIRSAIERTAEKVGGYDYTHSSEYPNGSWNEEMGYGRINMGRALDFADVYIKDNPLHNGSMYFDGDFYSESDIVVRSTDDTVFEHQGLTRDATNYIYVRVTNGGPATARNVQVTVRATNFPGTEFTYSRDWQNAGDDPLFEETHLLATQFSPDPDGPDPVNLEAGQVLDFRFTLSPEQVATLDEWTHPCLLAEVQCDNDYCEIMDDTHTWEHNNLAQRNISFAPVTLSAPFIYPFISGHEDNMDPFMEIVIDRHRLPRQIELLFNPTETTNYFPTAKIECPNSKQTVTFLERTRLATSLCGCEGILTLEAGSSFRCGDPCQTGIVLKGAEFVDRDGKRLIAIRDDKAVIGIQKNPGERRQMSLSFQVGDKEKAHDQYRIDVQQRNMKQQVVGGVAVVAQINLPKKG